MLGVEFAIFLTNLILRLLHDWQPVSAGNVGQVTAQADCREPSSACTHPSQCGSDALFRQSCLPLFLALLAFETLQRRQKPRRLWLAINHGDRSFRNTGAASSDCSCRLRSTGPIICFLGNIRTHPPSISYAVVATGCQEFCGRFFGPRHQLHPDVAPHVSHLQQEPLRTSVNWPHSLHGSPS